MSGTQRAKKTKKHRKYERNKDFCDMYKRTNQREKNKVKKLARHLHSHPGDSVAIKAKEVARFAISGR